MFFNSTILTKVQNSFKSACYTLPQLGREHPFISKTSQQVAASLGNLKSKPLASLTISSNAVRTSPFRNLTYLHLFLSHHSGKGWFFSTSIYSLWGGFQNYSVYFLQIYRKTLGDGFLYIRGLFVIFFVDACLTDDEPIWEPVEWSLIQSWILFIFAFGWIAENLISSRYGSYTGRDKRVWFSWYKMFWVVICLYILSLGAAALFVMTPFYHEISSLLPMSVSWWDWYTRIFFAKFIQIYTIALLIAIYLQVNNRVFNWKKSFLLIVTINLFLLYLIYTHFFMSFFMYLTDPNWYSKTRLVDYVQLSHEPNKWSWGSAKRDHFSYHKSSTVFWFKNDGPFASAFLVIHLFFFAALFGMNFFWLTLLRRVYTTQEVSYTFLTYCVSALKQFFYFFLFLYFFVLFSFVISYLKLPIEFFWVINVKGWTWNFGHILLDYPAFLGSLF